MIIVVLAVGIGVGYFITRNIPNGQIVKEVSSGNIKTETEKILETNTITNVVEEIPQYDGSKNITVNGKNYTINYINKFNTEEDRYDVTLYLNNSKIKSYNCPYDIQEGESSKPDIEVSSIIGTNANNEREEYIIITINSYYVAPSLLRDFLIIDTNGNIIGTLHDDNGEGIIIKDGKEWTSEATRIVAGVEIKDDHIILYDVIYQDFVTDQNGDPAQWKNFGIKYKISITEDRLEKNVEYVYTEDEAEFAGK